MPIVKLTLSEELHERLKGMAQEENKSVQDYIRDKIFGLESIFTPEEAVRRIQEKNWDEGYEFSLPDAYGNEWTIERGPAGVFGRKFFNYVKGKPELGISYVNMGKYGRRAVYTITKKECSENGK